MKKLTLSKEMGAICILLIFVLASALAVVYVKNLQRVYFSKGQELHQQANQLQLEWGQLLLEKSTWATPSRVQSIAQQRLNRVLPATKQIIIVKP